MDNLPIFPFILRSLPESIIVILFGLALTGSKANIKNTFIAASLATIFSYVIRSLPIIFGIHTVLQLVFLILMVHLILKLSIIAHLCKDRTFRAWSKCFILQAGNSFF